MKALFQFLRLLRGGCAHSELSRPFGPENKAYRACLRCGARRRFDLKSFEMSGNFYFPREQRWHNEFQGAALRSVSR